MRNRNYIGGVGKATPFLKSDNSGDYTTEDIVVTIRDNKVTIPKGTYIGVGALNEDFVKIKGISASNYTPQDVLHGLRAEYTSWYKDNESKDNYGYTDPKTFIKDTYTNNAYYMSGADDNPTTGGGADILNATDEQLDKYLENLTERTISKPEDGSERFASTERTVASLAGQSYTSSRSSSDDYKSYYPRFTLPLETPPPKIEPKKVTSIEINRDEPKLQKAIPYLGGVGSSKADLFFEGLETAKVYENRPDEFSDDAAKNVKGKKTVQTQYVFSDKNPFKPKGRYFMSSANTKGKRKKDGNLNKAREWERKYGLGVQKDVVGYIPNLEFGG